jgi:hypothetical protein
LNPAAFEPLHVEPFGKAWGVVETLGVIAAFKTRAEAEAKFQRITRERFEREKRRQTQEENTL